MNNKTPLLRKDKMKASTIRKAMVEAAEFIELGAILLPLFVADTIMLAYFLQ